VGNKAQEVGAQASDVDAHAHRDVRLESAYGCAQLAQRTAAIATPQVQQAHAGQQDALVQVADRIGLATPELFQRFVALPVVATVKLSDACL
jgi:hypothetical protein